MEPIGIVERKNQAYQVARDEPRPRGIAPSRVIIEGVAPEIDAGQFPIKRTVGEPVRVSADIFADGHDVLKAVLKHRSIGAATWNEVAMALVGQGTDRFAATFAPTQLGRHEYTIEAWIDRFGSWHHEVTRKLAAEMDLTSELLEGAAHIREAAGRANDDDANWLRDRAHYVASDSAPHLRAIAGLDPELVDRMARYPDRTRGVVYERTLGIMVERERARFSAWYEMFPRSAAAEPGQHGTFRDVERLLPYVAGMGFNVLYLPPIHPIGLSFRKGPNNSLYAGPADPGSPWAIGSADGGHKSVHSQLGTLDDFDRLVAASAKHGLEIALDIAFQASPDHPWVQEHPEFFRKRPDGTIKYAENPPKKYQDIYPIDFEGDDWPTLYDELRDVFLFWADRGVKIFRVDNPHTKPFRFWDWVIREVWDRHPDTIFLAEAFTRPKLMKRLAKGGYSHSYSYFTWRNDKAGLIDYFTELTTTECVDYMRPNLFANTPDILNEYLQYCGRPGFQIRLVLAATLAGNYGIYGPPYELSVGNAVRYGSEEYHDSEKYQVRHWNRDHPDSLRDYIARINAIRRDNAALHYDRGLVFYPIDNDKLIAYGKTSPDGSNSVLVVVNLDPHHTQSGWLHLPQGEFGTEGAFQVHDLIGDSRYQWVPGSNFIELNPHVSPAHIFRIRRKMKSEHDFDYYV